jgi:ribosomal protein S18 acetylase RimI-like enzyme
VRDTSVLAAWLRRDVAMNIFGLCDLDRGERERTTWMALEEDGEILSLLLVYSADKIPLVLLHGPLAEATALLGRSTAALPRRFRLSVALPFDDELKLGGARVESHANYLRMIPGPRTAGRHERHELIPLVSGDAGRVRRLLFDSRAYPDAWFDERTLRTGLYRGWVEEGELLGIAGVHAASEEHRVAVIGNLAVRPDARGRGIGRVLMEAVAGELKTRGFESAFNVRPDNADALAVYAKTGCRAAGTIREFDVTLAWPVTAR